MSVLSLGWRRAWAELRGGSLEEPGLGSHATPRHARTAEVPCHRPRARCAPPFPPPPPSRRAQDHHESKHTKLPWDPEACQDMHAIHGGVTVKGVAVRGSVYKKGDEKKDEKKK